jgi:hypothetical protein
LGRSEWYDLGIVVGQATNGNLKSVG